MAPGDRIGAHMKSGFGGDPVEDHTKHNGKRNTNLTFKKGLQTFINRLQQNK